MRTLLDEAHTWFLETLSYTEELCAVLVEGACSPTPEDVEVGGGIIRDAHAVEPSEDSRRVAVHFPRTVAWQVVDESYTAWDETEIRDGKGFLTLLKKSAYLDYVVANHGWFQDMAGAANHYRLWTEDEVIDAVAHAEPRIERLP